MIAEELLRFLADGEYHSGQKLANHFRVTRAAIWKQIKKLEEWGLVVEAKSGLGYRLDRQVEMLNRRELSAAIRGSADFELARLDVFTELPSTNKYLADNPPRKAASLTACVAEYQSAGRGRHGRSWQAPLGAGVCLSLGWRFADSPPQLTALPLAVGVVVRRAIGRVAGIDLDLKWPNDLVFQNRKLGGILVELAAEAQGQSQVVIGIGINVAMPARILETLSDWPAGAIDLHSAQPQNAITRHALCTSLILEVGKLLADYEASGFDGVIHEWREADHLLGRPICVQRADGRVSGTAIGIDRDAALLVDVEGEGVVRVVSGDVRVRTVQ